MSLPPSPTDLTDDDLDRFVELGFVHRREAFPGVVAEQCRELLWTATGCDPDDPTTWTRPVVRIGGRADPPFQAAATSPRLHATFDQLVGPHRWLPRVGLGTFPIRFPHPHPPGDDGWHLDAGWHVTEDDPAGSADDVLDLDPSGYRVNLASRGRALLMLFLFSDVGPLDAPTRIAAGSHLRVPRLLAAAGDTGTPGDELPPLDDLPVVEATGRAGDVYLCHPFLVHAAQPHRGTAPRFIAQPPLHPTGGDLGLGEPAAERTPVVRAIRLGLQRYPPAR